MGTEKHGETWGQTERFPDFSDIFFCPMTRLSSFLPRGANQGHRNAPFFFRAAVSSHLRISAEIQGSQSFLAFHKFLGGAMRHCIPCVSDDCGQPTIHLISRASVTSWRESAVRRGVGPAACGSHTNRARAKRQTTKLPSKRMGPR